MVPTFKNGDVILINRLSYILKNPKVNDIIVLRDPRNGREILKRIVKIKGDTYSVEGDNKRESTDSKVFGSVKKNTITGRFIRLI